MGCRRHRLCEERPSFGGSGAAVLRSDRQTGKLPGSGEPVGDHRDGKHAGGVWVVPAPAVGPRQGKKTKSGVPAEVVFRTKPQIALEQIRRARQRAIPEGVILADAGYGTDTRFRSELTEMGLSYVVGIMSSISVWRLGEQPQPAKKWNGKGRRTKLLQRDPDHPPMAVKELAVSLSADDWKRISWRQGVNNKLRSRFAAVRIRPAHRDYYWRAEPHPEQWLLIEWPADQPEPTRYWLSTLPADTPFPELIRLAKHRWIIERDYEELKQELGLGHFEGRGWRGFHHHATLCIAAYGFLVAERSRFSPSARAGQLALSVPKLPPEFEPRGRPSRRRTA